MPVLTTITTALTLANLVECIINGSFENAPAAALKGIPILAERLKKQFGDAKPEVNGHLQKAILSAHWMATIVFVKQMHKKGLLKDSYNNVNQTIKKELKEIKNENYHSEENSPDVYNVTSLIKLPKEENVIEKLEADLLDFHLKLLDKKTGDVKKQEDYKKLKDFIQNGWKDENLNWFQLMTAFLNQLLKGDNNKAKDAFQNQTLAEITLKLNDFETYAENCIQGIGEDRFRGFEDYLKEEISRIKVSLNQLHDKFDKFSSETKEEIKKLTDAISANVPKEFYGRTDLLKLIGELDEIQLLFQKEQIKRKGFLNLLKLGADEDFLNEQLNEVDIEVLKVDGLKRNKLDEIKDFINYTTKNYLDFISNEIKNDEELIRIDELYKSGKFEDAENVIDSKRHQDSVRRRLELKEVEIVRDKILSDKSTFLANDTLAKKETHWFEKANKYFSETVALFPSYDTYSRYALFLQNHRQFEKAAIEYKKALRHTSNNVQIALTLNRLGNTQCENHELEKAGLSFGKALEIVRDLTKGSPSIYKHDLTMTLNNLGNLHRQKNEFESAECSYKESIQISRDLAKETPSIHLPDLAMTLNNLGDLFRKKMSLKMQN
jgi:tetratricopeptide (TPR) repeat protein